MSLYRSRRQPPPPDPNPGVTSRIDQAAAAVVAALEYCSGSRYRDSRITDALLDAYGSLYRVGRPT